MTDEGVPEELQPSIRQLESRRHRAMRKDKQYDAEFVCTMNQFLSTPPKNVSIASGPDFESIANESMVRMFFFNPDLFKKGIELI